MKNFLNDYWTLTKDSCKFIKKHPIGVGIIMLVGASINAAAIFVPDMIEKKRIEKEIEEVSGSDEKEES